MSSAHSGGDISRSLELMWQGRERATRGPKPALTLERIVGAAVALADREGLTALSMRRVAAELGVGTMSLYRYVPGKGELIDLMLDHLAAPDEEEERALREAEWRPALEAVAWSTYRHYHDHPWLLQVNQARPLLGPNALRAFDASLAVLDGLGLSSPDKISIISAIDAYITGLARHYVLLRQANEESGITDEEFWAAQGPIMATAMNTGDYPHVFALDETAFARSTEDSIRFGLDRLLDGIEAYVAAKRDDPAYPPPGGSCA
ncbi:TetR/AcrR family transcriptional regulator [Streptomyces sp. PT12]|uniref:TetR/AcrR family transcriptional regulator n=1 Tax=Streptomyces sp. PT12 TaxID=1510197 RepID=UPI000DE2E7C6|nr:TetR/AcrR family transcriptional regulator [Streptomyces sp. PT12]RBM17764.1 TetR family transcriptional regulator [Streptomyces sp. PT12]